MKKNVFAYLIAASSVFAINNALAADGTIDFTGEITDQACQFATGSDAFTVNLGKISKTALPSTGSTAAATKFTIKLENCPQTVTSATVKFDATSYAGDNSVLQLTDPTAATTAQNVGISEQQQLRYERGNNRISIDRLKQYSNYFDINIIYFFSFSEDEKTKIKNGYEIKKSFSL